MFCLRALINKRRGFTVIEVLLAALVGAVLVGGLGFVLINGDATNDISSTKVSAQSEARQISDWITRDLRQAQLGNLALNVSHISIKFNPVLGVNVDGTYQLDYSQSIQYVYNENAQTLTRNLLNGSGGVLKSWVYANVVESPFFTRVGSDLSDLSNSVLTTKNIVSVITVTKLARTIDREDGQRVEVMASLTAETKIRNE